MSKKELYPRNTDLNSNLNCVPPRRESHLLCRSSHPGSQLGLFYENEASKLCSSQWTEQISVFW